MRPFHFFISSVYVGVTIALARVDIVMCCNNVTNFTLRSQFQDERFNHDIDARTGYKTKSLLCMPIKDCNGEVIGVAQVSF